MTRRRRSDRRSRAEAKIARHRKKPAPQSPRSAELEVHRVELDLQSEALRTAHGLMEAALARFTKVFDFAPIGYAVLDAGQRIREINHVGAALLGAQRGRLIGRWLATYVARPGRGDVAFQALLDQACAAATHSVQAELEFLRGDQPWLARVTAAALPRSVRIPRSAIVASSRSPATRSQKTSPGRAALASTATSPSP